jgi:hypothetical protein
MHRSFLLLAFLPRTADEPGERDAVVEARRLEAEAAAVPAAVPRRVGPAARFAATVATVAGAGRHATGSRAIVPAAGRRSRRT